jgi:uncharacterized protein YkwD
VNLSRCSSALLLTTLSCVALIAGPASTAAASRSAAIAASELHARATVAERAHASCARHTTPAARRSCRLERKLHAKDTTKPHAAKSRAPKPHDAKSRPEKSPHAKTLRTKSTEPATPEATSAASPPASAERTAATIAAVLATPCANTELTPEAGNIPLVRAAVLCLINRKRAENDESPLITSPDLERAAESHCEELIADDYFAHVSPSGETPVDRIRDTGYIPGPNDGYVIGENLAWGTYQLSTAQSIASAWFASPGHLANILEAQYQETGIAITPAVPESLAPGATGATYAQEFGVIIP